MMHNDSCRLGQLPKPSVAASILAADFARMGEECASALEGGADLLHLDVMDGHFVPNLTMGPTMCAALRRQFPKVCLDVHMMVSEPAKFVGPFAEAGASHFTFHIEAVDQPAALAKTIRQAGMTAGLALNPPTVVAEILPYIGEFELILVMSVNPGFAGQKFIPSALDKATALRGLLRADQRLEVDGGVSVENAQRCREAGFDVLVAASAIFGASDYKTAIAQLRQGR